ncbi:MAG TPA: hypothetical protein VMK12_27675 [Anaeromyxobacteraceae bacterium]|nr:hypothetical protein [Anaeromyxobacteraceae bacterium]
MLLFAAGALAAASFFVAARSARSQRSLSREVQSLRSRLSVLRERVATAERDIKNAVNQAEATGNVLLKKGLADREELEAARHDFGGSVEPQAVRSRTVH